MPHYGQHSMQNGFSTSLRTYATLHLDSISKIINHVLAVMFVCDIFLFLSSWSVSSLPNVGFNTVFISFLLCAQTVCVWLIVNNNRISALSFLSPTEFMVGIALGITIGAAFFALVLSGAYRQVSRCGHETTAVSGAQHSNVTNVVRNFDDPVQLYQILCEQHKGAMTAVWFWSGLVFWFNSCTCLLLSVGKDELTNDVQSQYEHIEGSENYIANSSRVLQNYEEEFRRTQAGLPAGQMMSHHSPAAPAFAGDYATIPDIRTGNGASNNSSSSSRSHQNAIVQQV